jgi:transforming growth factor-beta-induced protein
MQTSPFHVSLPKVVTLTLAAALSFVASCGSDDKDDAPANSKQTLLTAVVSEPDLSTLASLVKLCKAEALFTKETQHTLFAPSNAAFKAALGATLPKSCSSDVADILSYHLINGTVKSTAAKDSETALASGKGDVFVKKTSAGVVINNSAKVTAADKVASNGVLHIIDKVLIPDSLGTVVDIAIKRDSFSSLVKLVTLCNLGGALSADSATLTVFAPTNSAFSEFLGTTPFPTTCPDTLKNTLLYHVLGSKVKSTDLAATQAPESLLAANKVYVTKKDGMVTVNGGSKVVAADVVAANGVVHVVDKVLLPDAQGTIVAALQKRYDATTLVASVAKANLVETLNGTGPFTVFAPTDAAFEAIDSAVAALSVAQLTKVLTHHVVSGSKSAADIIAGGNLSSLATEEGSNVEVAVVGTPTVVKIKGSGQGGQADSEVAQVTETDIIASNGVIHRISGVLIPLGL